MKYFVTAILALGLGSAADASTFTFDSFSHSDHVTSVTSDDGLISAGVSATGGINQAWAFDTTLSNTEDPDLEGPFPHYLGTESDLDAGRALIIQESRNRSADDVAGGGTITFTFAKAVDFLGFTVIDDGRFTVSSTSVLPANNFVADLHVTDDDRRYGIFNTGNTFFGVTDLTFTLNHSGAIDSLRFVAPVPLPAGLPLLAAGLGALGFLRRRQKA